VRFEEWQLASSGNNARETPQSLERVKKHVKDFHKNCAKKNPDKQYSEFL
jgi:hypothetical protein